MQKIVRKLLRAVANYDPKYYDMHADASEQFFGQCYVEWITRHGDAAGIRPPATLLEAGCQAGRLVVPLAQRGFRVTGIDTSGFALGRARQHVKAAGTEATFVRGDLIEVLRKHPDWRYDIVICAEVTYLSSRYREMLQALAKAVRPRGLLCVAHRPKFYYLLEALRQYDLVTAAQILDRSEGRLELRDRGYFNWQTEEELRTLYQSLGLRWVAMHVVDRLSWLSGVKLEQLTDLQRQQWLELELRLSDEAGAWGRYLFVVAAAPDDAKS